jgi:hypothetical protein
VAFFAGAHSVPQAPQFALSFCASTQVSPHARSPLVHIAPLDAPSFGGGEDGFGGFDVPSGGGVDVSGAVDDGGGSEPGSSVAPGPGAVAPGSGLFAAASGLVADVSPSWDTEVPLRRHLFVGVSQ